MRRQPKERAHQKEAGFSLIEMIVAVGGVVAVAMVAAVALGGVRETVASQKLSNELGAINSAVRLYQINGGDIANLSAAAGEWAADGIEVLKSRATDESAVQVAGVTGRFVDARLKPIMQTAAEGATGEPRILWDSERMRFVMAKSGARGIKRFEMVTDTGDTTSAGGTEERTGTMKLAAVDGWVWDYTDPPPLGGPGGPTEVTLVAETTGTSGAGLPTPLLPPTFVVAPANYALSNYPMAVTFGNPNDPAVSTVLYSLGGTWLHYGGGSIVVEPGGFVALQAQAKDTAHWEDSATEDGTYTTTAEAPTMEFAGPVAVNYADVGGAMMAGGPPWTPLGPGTMALSNEAAIPDYYENSDHFDVYWTTDGGDPSDPATPGRQMAPGFSGGFPGQLVDFALANWGGQVSFPLKMFAQSKNEMLFTDSTVETHTILISQLELRPPQVAVAGSSVTLSYVTSFGDMPSGARIYYTTDGTDPGDDGMGSPVAGTEYTGPFVVTSGSACGGTGIPVMARVYGPTGYEHWFEVSVSASGSVIEQGPEPGTFEALVCDLKLDLCEFGWFSTGGELTASAPAEIGGDAGVGPGGISGVGAGVVKGTLFRDPTATGNADEVVDLSDEVATAFRISEEFGGLAATQTFNRLQDGTTVSATAPDGVNVISVDWVKINSGGVLNFDGGPDDWFIVNVNDKFTLNGNATIGGTADPSKVLFNILPSVSQVKLTGQGNAIMGSILAPTHWVKLQGGGEIGGQVISAGGNLGDNSKVRQDYMFGGACE